jgi:hypothetical protein
VNVLINIFFVFVVGLNISARQSRSLEAVGDPFIHPFSHHYSNQSWWIVVWRFGVWSIDGNIV